MGGKSSIQRQKAPEISDKKRIFIKNSAKFSAEKRTLMPKNVPKGIIFDIFIFLEITDDIIFNIMDELLINSQKAVKISENQIILMPKNAPPELIFDIFTFLDRINDIEKCKTVNKSWKNFIEHRSNLLRYHEFHQIAIYDRGNSVMARMETIRSYNVFKTPPSKQLIPIKYEPNAEEPWKLNYDILKIITRSYFRSFYIDAKENKENLWIFMEKFKSLVGKLNVLKFNASGIYYLTSNINTENAVRLCGKFRKTKTFF